MNWFDDVRCATGQHTWLELPLLKPRTHEMAYARVCTECYKVEYKTDSGWEELK